MNRTLTALFTKIKWQMDEVYEKLHVIDRELSTLEQKIHLNQLQISNSYTIPPSIVPEQEIARNHFMTLQQQELDELTVNKTTLQSDQQALKQQQTQLNTEIKMLENHHDNMLKKQQHQTRLNEQNNSDEWVLQRRGQHEN